MLIFKLKTKKDDIFNRVFVEYTLISANLSSINKIRVIIDTKCDNLYIFHNVYHISFDTILFLTHFFYYLLTYETAPSVS